MLGKLCTGEIVLRLHPTNSVETKQNTVHKRFGIQSGKTTGVVSYFLNEVITSSHCATHL